MTATPTDPPPAQTTGARTLKAIGLAVFALVALCGLLGSCLFALTLILPALGQ